MEPLAITLLGLLAAALTTFSFVPQVAKAWKTRETKDISLAMFVVFSVGVLLWLAYGLVIQNVVLIIANVVTFALTSVMIIFKMRYG